MYSPIYGILILYLHRFLHASLHLARLEHCRTVGDLRDLLAEFPPALESHYYDTLSRMIQEPELDAFRGKAILQWMVFCLTPLTLEDLQFILAIDARGFFKADRVLSKEIIVALCHGLVTVDSKTRHVCLVRTSTKTLSSSSCWY